MLPILHYIVPAQRLAGPVPRQENGVAPPNRRVHCGGRAEQGARKTGARPGSGGEAVKRKTARVLADGHGGKGFEKRLREIRPGLFNNG